MRNQSSTRAMVEAGILTSITVVLILISIYIPVLYMVGIFIWPLPITFIYLRHGTRYSIMSLIVAAIITAMLYDPVSAINIALTFGIMSIVLGYCIKTKKGFFFSVIVMSAAMFISMIFALKVFSVFAGQDIIGLLTQQINLMRDMAKQMYSQMGIPRETQELALSALPTVEMFKLLLPIGLLLGCVVMAFISYLIAGKVFEKFGYNLSRIKPLSEWYMPMQLAIAIIGLVLLAYAMLYFKVKNSEVLFINVNILFQFAFAIDGLAAVDYFMKKKDVAKGLRVFIIIFLLVSQLGRFLYLIGIVDYAMDLRKLDVLRNRRA